MAELKGVSILGALQFSWTESGLNPDTFSTGLIEDVSIEEIKNEGTYLSKRNKNRRLAHNADFKNDLLEGYNVNITFSNYISELDAAFRGGTYTNNAMTQVSGGAVLNANRGTIKVYTYGETETDVDILELVIPNCRCLSSNKAFNDDDYSNWEVSFECYLNDDEELVMNELTALPSMV